jgi:signal transduction histidine kinase
LGHEDGRSLVGRSLVEFLSEEDVRIMRERIEGMTRGERYPPREYRARRDDGTYVVAEITSLPCLFEGEPAVIGFARDVTERAAMREQLQRADRLVSLGTLAAGVAHEINNPMAVSALASDALAQLIDRAGLPAGVRDEMHALVSNIRLGTERVSAIVRDLKTFSRVEEEGPGPVNLEEVLANAQRMATHAVRHGATLRAEVDALPPVLGTPGSLEQVFVNLLINAAQAFPVPRTDNEIVLRARADGHGKVVVEVQDNGCGIPEEVRARIFDPFFTTKPVGVGTGLGLSISHGIVVRHRGEITCESAPGVGTTMRVTLPVLDPAAVAAPVVIIDRPRGASKQRDRILVIDDERALLVTLKMLLRENHDIVTAESAEEALALFARGEKFDLVLCDLMMPRLTGMDLYEHLRRTSPRCAERLVFMTGGAFTPRAAGFLSSVKNPRLEKPFTAEAVERLLAMRET